MDESAQLTIALVENRVETVEKFCLAMFIGDRATKLRAVRCMLGMTQSEVSDRLGLGNTTYAHAEGQGSLRYEEDVVHLFAEQGRKYLKENPPESLIVGKQPVIENDLVVLPSQQPPPESTPMSDQSGADDFDRDDAPEYAHDPLPDETGRTE